MGVVVLSVNQILLFIFCLVRIRNNTLILVANALLADRRSARFCWLFYLLFRLPVQRHRASAYISICYSRVHRSVVGTSHIALLYRHWLRKFRIWKKIFSILSSEYQWLINSIIMNNYEIIEYWHDIERFCLPIMVDNPTFNGGSRQIFCTGWNSVVKLIATTPSLVFLEWP